MTDQEIFEKIIKKAIENGWDMFGYLKKNTIRAKNFERYYFTNQNYTHTAGNHESWKMQQLSIESTTSGGYGAYLHIPVREIVFDHNFSKAFWGDKEVCTNLSRLLPKDQCDCMEGDFGEESHNLAKLWEFHLSNLVLEENPMRYFDDNT